ncbi:MAG: GntR family transcriptional regulator [Bacillota bacterium]|nr:GntR family transcriptional regulator [Bacillota bacterium]
MVISFDSQQPIFQQIADGIEDAILAGAFEEEAQIPSITELSVNYKINPATALKGINLLVDSGLVYKKRGLGMFVAPGAVERLKEIRRARFFDSFVRSLIEEAERLGLSKGELWEMIERGFEK